MFGSKTCKELRNQVVHVFVGKTFQAEGRTNAMVLRQKGYKQVSIKRDWRRQSRLCKEQINIQRSRGETSHPCLVGNNKALAFALSKTPQGAGGCSK